MVVPPDEVYNVTELQAITISTFFSPDLDAGLPRMPDSNDNVGKRSHPAVQKHIASRDSGGVVRSTTWTAQVSSMTILTKLRFSRDTCNWESHEMSFTCAGAKAVTNNPKQMNLASLLGILKTSLQMMRTRWTLMVDWILSQEIQESSLGRCSHHVLSCSRCRCCLVCTLLVFTTRSAQLPFPGIFQTQTWPSSG